MSKSSANIIHLSDLHFGYTKLDKNEMAKVFRNLIYQINSIHKKDPIDFLIISGDIGFSGKRSDYDETEGDGIFSAGDFINKISNIFNGYKTKIIVCPGNHDVQHKEFKGVIDPLKAEDRDAKYEKELTSNKINEKGPLIKEFKEFNKFCSKYDRIFKPTSFLEKFNYLTGYVYFDDFNLAFVIINTAWLSSPFRKNDFDCLLVNRKMVQKLYEDVNKKSPEVVITIMHHPPYFLKWSERFSNSDNSIPILNTIVNNSEIILAGHEHCTVLPPDKILSNSLLFITGAAYEKPNKENEDFYSNAFHNLYVDYVKKSVFQNIYEYSRHNNGINWKEINPEEVKEFNYLSHKKDREEPDIEVVGCMKEHHYHKITCGLIEKYKENCIIFKDFPKKYNINAYISEVMEILKKEEKFKLCLGISKNDIDNIKLLEKAFGEYIQVNRCMLELY